MAQTVVENRAASGGQVKSVEVQKVRSIVGKKEQTLLLEDGATLRVLLEELGRSNGPEFQRYIVFQGTTVNPALLVALNGESVDEIQNLDTPLPTGATLDVMLTVPISGGQGG